MKKIGRVTLATILVLGLSINLFGCENKEKTNNENKPGEVTSGYDSYKEMENSLVKNISGNTEIEYWYTSESDTAYLQSAADVFFERYGIKVTLNLYSGIDYLGDINKANTKDKGPDIFMLSNDQIKKANLAGLISENTTFSHKFLRDNYPSVVKNALISEEKTYGYPVYFDTCFLVYNSSLVEKAPKTIDEILEFANDFEDTEGNKTIFKWNVADPFYDYMFLGGYTNVLGDFGEDTSNFNVTSDKTIETMTYFQSLSQYFSMDADDNSYEEIKKEVTEGTLIYSICKTDFLRELANEDSVYKLAALPKLTTELEISPISITYGAMINEYSDNKAAANLFSAFISYEYADKEYSTNYKISCRDNIDRTDDNEKIIFKQYADSKAIPKALEMGDFWIYSEIAFKNIWKGKDVKTELTTFQENMLSKFE